MLRHKASCLFVFLRGKPLIRKASCIFVFFFVVKNTAARHPCTWWKKHNCNDFTASKEKTKATASCTSMKIS